MTAAIRKTTALVVLAAYVSAGTLLHRFHDHPARDAHTSGCDCAGSAEHQHGEHRSNEPADGKCGLVAGPSNLSSAHVCAVCAFLAQKPAPSEPVREVTITPLEALVSRVAALGHSAPPAGPQHPRAPPVLA
ncbi:MAG: hypothetical protein NTW96_18205 [Planctomycetia bacterium]|nr:hypothetical protein [Planctomycetia bacterium]